MQINDNHSASITEINSPECKSQLIEKQSQLQSAFLKNELRSNRLLTFAPTVSFIFNQAWQQNSNVSFFDANAYHFSTQYFGLKVTVPLPIDVNRLSQNYTAKVNYSIAKINSEHATLQNELSNKQLDLDYQKALSGWKNGNSINKLKELNYTKSMNQYKEGIITTENLLLSFTDKVNAQLNLIGATATLQYTQSKIKINNTIQ